MIKLRVKLTLMLLMTGLLHSQVSAQQDANWQVSQLRIHGSNTVGEKYAPLLISEFLKKQGFALIETRQSNIAVEQTILATDIEIDIETISQANRRIDVELHAHGSSTGFKDLLAGKTDIAMSSRKIKPTEQQQLAAIYPSFASGDAEHIIAYDALAIVLHPDNPVETLTLSQIAAIFSGEIADWSELGAEPGAIRVLARDNNSGTFDTFKSLVLKQFDQSLIESAERFESSKQLADTVESDSHAIGFVGISHIGNNKVLSIATEQGASGIKPDKFTIGTEDYPLSRKLYLYWPTEIDLPAAQAFVEFAMSESGQRLAKQADLISFFPTGSRPSFKGQQLLKPYANLVTFGRRLSVMLRLEDNQVDAKVRRDLQRIARYKEQNPHNRMVLAGFWDDPEFTESSQQQVKQWMHLLKKELINYKVQPWEVQGGFLPIENNDIASGKAVNRRIEVWVL